MQTVVIVLLTLGVFGVMNLPFIIGGLCYSLRADWDAAHQVEEPSAQALQIASYDQERSDRALRELAALENPVRE